MFKTSHLQELKRRYASIYAPPVEEKVIEDGTDEGVKKYKKDTPGQDIEKEFKEHCGVCGEQGIEEDEIEEGTALQVKMALSDVGLKGTWKNNKVYVKKRDVKKAEKALKGNVIYKGKPPVVVGEEVEEAHKVECPKCKGEGCEHCDGKGYHIKEEVELDEKATAYPATIDTLKQIVKDKQHQTVMFDKGKAKVDLFSASAMIQVYNALKQPALKKKFEDMIKSKEGFLKTQAFAFKMAGK